MVTSKFISHYRRQPSPFELDPYTPINEWYLKYREGSAFQVTDWEGFNLPGPMGMNSQRSCWRILLLTENGAVIGAWLCSCDICQSVCPWNSKSEREMLPRGKNRRYDLFLVLTV